MSELEGGIEFDAGPNDVLAVAVESGVEQDHLDHTERRRRNRHDRGSKGTSASRVADTFSGCDEVLVDLCADELGDGVLILTQTTESSRPSTLAPAGSPFKSLGGGSGTSQFARTGTRVVDDDAAVVEVAAVVADAVVVADALFVVGGDVVVVVSAPVVDGATLVEVDSGTTEVVATNSVLLGAESVADGSVVVEAMTRPTEFAVSVVSEEHAATATETALRSKPTVLCRIAVYFALISVATFRRAGVCRVVMAAPFLMRSRRLLRR